MLDINVANMPDIEGILDVDGDSDAIPNMGGIEFIGIVESITLLCGMEPVIGSFIADDSTILDSCKSFNTVYYVLVNGLQYLLYDPPTTSQVDEVFVN